MRLPLILRRVVLALSSAAFLTACNDEADMDPGARLVKVVSSAAIARIKGGKDGPAVTPPSDLEVRAALQAAGKPILRLTVEATGTTTFLAPVGLNRGVTTWSSNERVTLSGRDGVLQASRGFGADLMSAKVPSASQIRNGSGGHDRVHVYLDGGDQTQVFTFTCTLAPVGSERITVMGLSFVTSHVRETCTGTAGAFTNDYWFDGATIRQSVQALAPGVPGVTVQAVID